MSGFYFFSKYENIVFGFEFELSVGTGFGFTAGTGTGLIVLFRTGSGLMGTGIGSGTSCLIFCRFAGGGERTWGRPRFLCGGAASEGGP